MYLHARWGKLGKNIKWNIAGTSNAHDEQRCRGRDDEDDELSHEVVEMPGVMATAVEDTATTKPSRTICAVVQSSTVPFA